MQNLNDEFSIGTARSLGAYVFGFGGSEPGKVPRRHGPFGDGVDCRPVRPSCLQRWRASGLGPGFAFAAGAWLGFSLPAENAALAQPAMFQAPMGMPARGPVNYQFVPIETYAVEQLGGGAIRVSTPVGVQVLEAGQWLFTNGQVMALSPVMAAPALSAGTVLSSAMAPVMIQMPTASAAPAAASLAVANAPSVAATAFAGPSLTQIGVAAGGATVASASVYAGYRLLRSEDSLGAVGGASASGRDDASSPSNTAEVDGTTDPGEPEQQLNLPGHGAYFTGDLLVDSLLSEDESHWSGAGLFDTPATVTYSFADNGSALSLREGETVQSIPAFFRAKVREQLDDLQALANLTFVEVPDTGTFDAATGEGRGQINIAVADGSIGNSYAVLPVGDEPWLSDDFGDVVFDGDLLLEGYWVDAYRGGEMILTHEILHALGLEHPFEGYMDAPAYIDNQYFTALSYTEVYGDTVFPAAPMIADIAALQHLYGPNTTTATGNDVYTFDSQEMYVGTIWDAGGVDTIVHEGTRDAIINLFPGQPSRVGAPPSESASYSVESIGHNASDTISSIVIEDDTDGWAEIAADGKSFRLIFDPDTSDLDGDGQMGFTVFFEDGSSDLYLVDNDRIEVGLRDNLHIAQGVVIENAKSGSGDDQLIGNGFANTLNGGRGDDRLTGGGGADIFRFEAGFGNDVIQDFRIGEDRLEFYGIDSGTAELVAGDTVITVAGEGVLILEDADVTGLMASDILLV